MNVYFTSDLHLKHVNILRYSRQRFMTGTGPDGAPAPTPDDVERMTREVIARYNARVTDEDLVYVLGDVAMGEKALHPALVAQLKGKKTLVMGNHDERQIKDPTDGKRRPMTFEEHWKHWTGMGFIQVYQDFTYLSADYGSIYCRHIPTAKYQGDYHFCGHVHEDFDRLDRIINVGVDVRDLEPKTAKELIEAPFKGYLTDKPHRPMEDYEKDKN